MAKYIAQPFVFDADKYRQNHRRLIAGVGGKVADIFAKTAKKIATIGLSTGFNSDTEEFKWSDYPVQQKQAEKAVNGMMKDLVSAIEQSQVAAWDASNLKNDDMVKEILPTTDLPDDIVASFMPRNNEALKAFQERKVAGMNLSQRVWSFKQQSEREFEMALDVALGTGKSADELSRDIRLALKEPNNLFRRVRDKHGNLVPSKAMKAHVAGRGVYHSSYKNALRLAATETNMAYRHADNTRWRGLPFALGIEVSTSINNHNPHPDMCDELAGLYPLDFEFLGWHPFCRCWAAPKLADRKEMEKYLDDLQDGKDVSDYAFTGRVEDVPQGFKDWVEDNKARIKNAASVPYFIRDNYVDGDINKKGKWIKQIYMSEEEFMDIANSMNVTKHQEWVLYESDDLYIDSAWSRTINSELAEAKIGDVIPDDFMDAGSRQQIQTLDEVIAANKTPKDIRVYRRVTPKWLEREGIKFEEGEIVTEYGFTSTSGVEGKNVMGKKKTVRLEIDVPKGSNAFFSKNSDESEIILPRGSKFKVLSVRGEKGEEVIRLRLLTGQELATATKLTPEQVFTRALAKAKTLEDLNAARAAYTGDFEIGSEMRKLWAESRKNIVKATRTDKQTKAIEDRYEDFKQRRATFEKFKATAGANIKANAEKLAWFDTTQLAELDKLSHNQKAYRAKAKEIAQQVAAIRKDIKDLEVLIPDVGTTWSKQFTSEELHGVFDSVKKKIGDIESAQLNTYKYSDHLQQEAAKYTFEAFDYLGKNMGGVQQKYKTWEVSQAAYIKQLKVVEAKIWHKEATAKVADLDALYSSHSNSDKLKGFIDEAKAAFAAGDKAAFAAKAQEAENWSNYLDKLTAQRNARNARKKAAQAGQNAQTGTLGQLDDTSFFDAASRLHEARVNSTEYWKKASQDVRETWDEISLELASKKPNRAKINELLTKVGEDLENPYSQSRRDAAYIAHSKDEADILFMDDARAAWAKASKDMKNACEEYTRNSSSQTRFLRAMDGWYEQDRWYATRDVPLCNDLQDYISLNKLKQDTWIYRDERCAFTALKSGGLNPQDLNDKMDAYRVQVEAKIRKKRGMTQAEKQAEIDRLCAEYQKQCENELVGKIGTDPSMLSTSSNEKGYFSGTGGDNGGDYPKVRLEIYCPKGTEAIYADPYNHYNTAPTGKDGLWNGKDPSSHSSENETFLQSGTKFRIIEARWVPYDPALGYKYSDRWYIKVEVIDQNPRRIKQAKYVAGQGYAPEYE